MASNLMYPTREAWLNAYALASRVAFAQAGFPLPDKLRVSVGFPARNQKAIGQCWSDTASSDGHFEIFIHPAFQSDSAFMADILTHELCHTATPGAGHGRVFKKCALAVGLAGKMKSAGFPNKVPPAWAQSILDVLGPLPGASLVGSQPLAGPKKQKTNLVKAECTACGLIFRITSKWIEQAALVCPDLQCQGELEIGG